MVLCSGFSGCRMVHRCCVSCIVICVYIYITPPEKSTVFMGVVRANSRKIFEVEDKFSQNNYFC